MARPRKEIDVDALEKCAQRQWSTEELAAFFNVSRDTLERRYAAIIKNARQNGKAKLRDMQWSSAEKGNERMQIFLGKIYLEQREVTETKNDVTIYNEAEAKVDAELYKKNQQEID